MELCYICLAHAVRILHQDPSITVSVGFSIISYAESVEIVSLFRVEDLLDLKHNYQYSYSICHIAVTVGLIRFARNELSVCVLIVLVVVMIPCSLIMPCVVLRLSLNKRRITRTNLQRPIYSQRVLICSVMSSIGLMIIMIKIGELHV